MKGLPGAGQHSWPWPGPRYYWQGGDQWSGLGIPPSLLSRSHISQIRLGSQVSESTNKHVWAEGFWLMGDNWGRVSANERRAPQGCGQSDTGIIKDLSKSDGCHCLHIAANNSSQLTPLLPGKQIFASEGYCRLIMIYSLLSPVPHPALYPLLAMWLPAALASQISVTIVSQLCAVFVSPFRRFLWIMDIRTYNENEIFLSSLSLNPMSLKRLELNKQELNSKCVWCLCPI